MQSALRNYCLSCIEPEIDEKGLEGARSILTPSTNNALELFNLNIKNEETFRERLPLRRFFEITLRSTEKCIENRLYFELCLIIKLKYAKPPLAAKQIPIGQKRKRGRPKLATKALVID
ncbi:hypothetical protein ANTPLA_LOCUS10395 [Anthophora plagiata]